MRTLIVNSNMEEAEEVVSAIQIPWPDSETVICAKGEAGLEAVANEPFDLIVTDLTLPDMSGFAFLKRLQLFSSTPTIALRKELRDSDIVRSLQLGADECLSKPLNQLEFVARAQVILRRYPDKDKDFIIFGPLTLQANIHRAYIKGKEIALTRNENLALQRLMLDHGRITSYGSLARAIWGNDFPGANNALQMCICRVKRKLVSVSPDSKIITERGVGFRLVVTN